MISNIFINENNEYRKVKLALEVKAVLERGIVTDKQQVKDLNKLVEENPEFNPQQAMDALYECDATKTTQEVSLSNKVIQDLTYDFKTLAMYGALTPDLYPKREWISNKEGAPVACQVPWNPAVPIPQFDTRRQAIDWANNYLTTWEQQNGTSPVRFAGALV